MIELSCDSTHPQISETKHVKYLNKFIVNKRDNFHIIHFVHHAHFETILFHLNELHKWYSSRYQEIFDDYLSSFLSDYSCRNLFSEEIKKEILFFLNMNIKYDHEVDIEKLENLTLWSDGDRSTLIPDIGVSEADIRQLLNSD